MNRMKLSLLGEWFRAGAFGDTFRHVYLCAPPNLLQGDFFGVCSRRTAGLCVHPPVNRFRFSLNWITSELTQRCICKPYGKHGAWPVIRSLSVEEVLLLTHPPNVIDVLFTWNVLPSVLLRCILMY